MGYPRRLLIGSVALVLLGSLLALYLSSHYARVEGLFPTIELLSVSPTRDYVALDVYDYPGPSWFVVVDLRDGETRYTSKPEHAPEYVDHPVMWGQSDRYLLGFRFYPNAGSRRFAPFIFDNQSAKTELIELPGASSAAPEAVSQDGQSLICHVTFGELGEGKSGLYLVQRDGAGWSMEPVILDEQPKRYRCLWYGPFEGKDPLVLLRCREETMRTWFFKARVSEGAVMELEELGKDFGTTYGIDVSPDGRWLAVIERKETGPHELNVLYTGTGVASHRRTKLREHTAFVSFSPNSRHLLLWDTGTAVTETIVRRGQFHLLDTSSMEMRHLGNMAQPSAVAWLSEENFLVGNANELWRWNIATGEKVKIWRAND